MRHNYRNATLLKEEILCLAPRSCNLHAQLHLCLFLFSVHYFMDRQNDSAVAPTRLWLGQEISDIVDYCSNAGGFILVKTGFPHNIQHPLILLEADRAVPLRLESHPCSPRLPKCKCTFDNSILNNSESAVLADMAKVINSGGSLDTEDTNNSQLYEGCKESDKAYHCGFLSVRKINR